MWPKRLFSSHLFLQHSAESKESTTTPVGECSFGVDKPCFGHPIRAVFNGDGNAKPMLKGVFECEFYGFGVVGVAPHWAVADQGPKKLKLRCGRWQLDHSQCTDASPSVDTADLGKVRFLPQTRAADLAAQCIEERCLRAQCFEALKSESFNRECSVGRSCMARRVASQFGHWRGSDSPAIGDETGAEMAANRPPDTS